MPQPESRLVKRIQDYLVSEGAFVAKIHGGDNPFQRVGLPDLIVCYEGRFYGLEVKQPGNEPTAIQMQVLREIREAGGVGAVVESVAEVKNLLAYDPGWITGFYEGEGTVYIQNRISSRRSRLGIRIYQKDSTPLRYIQGYFGGNISQRSESKVHSLSINRQKEVMRFLETVGPLLKSKYRRDQLRAAVRKVEEATGESFGLHGYSSNSRTNSTASRSN